MADDPGRNRSFGDDGREPPAAQRRSDGEFDRWLADLTAGDQVRVRRRQRWLEQQAAEGATLVGLLRDVTERGTEVVLETTSGRRHTGVVAAVGIDFCIVSCTGRAVFVALRALAVIHQAGERSVAASGDRMGALDLTLQEALADRLDERPRVVVGLVSGERVHGDLSSVGHDVVTIRTDASPPRSIHVNAEAISDLVF